MTSQREQEGNIPNPFLNPIHVWQNYLIYWMGVSRNFYENAVRTNEQWLKTFWDPWFEAGNPSQRKTIKVERN